MLDPNKWLFSIFLFPYKSNSIRGTAWFTAIWNCHYWPPHFGGRHVKRWTVHRHSKFGFCSFTYEKQNFIPSYSETFTFSFRRSLLLFFYKYTVLYIHIKIAHNTTNSSKTVCMLSVFWLQTTTPLHRLKTSSLETASHQPIASHLHPPVHCLLQGSSMLEAPSENRSHLWNTIISHRRGCSSITWDTRVSPDVEEKRLRSTGEGRLPKTGCCHPLNELQLDSQAWG